jgi:hypothetical protein
MPDDEKLRRYLLGQLAEPERDALEDRLIVDGEWRAEVDAAERDLIDDYVRGRLEEKEKTSFEQLFGSSARRRQKVTFARAFTGAARASSATSRNIEPRIESRPWLLLLFPKARPAVGFALAAAILLMVVGVVWVVRYRQNPPAERAGIESNAARGEQASVPVSPTPENATAPNKGSNEQTATTGNNATTGATPNRRVQQTASVASFLVLPGSVRGSDDGQLLSIPARAQSVRLRLSLEGQPATGAVSVELRRLSADGELVWRTGIVRAQRSSLGPVVSMELPADKLPAGKYTALIKGAGDNGRVETVYAFSVTRK